MEIAVPGMHYNSVYDTDEEQQEEEVIEEEQEEELEEEPVEENQEDYGNEEPPADEDTDEEEDGDNFKITYTSEDGEEVTEELTEDELSDAVKLYKSGEYRNDPEIEETAKLAEPVIKHIRDSKLMQTIFYWKDKGYTEEQVMRGIYSMAKDSYGNETDEEEEFEEERTYTQKEINELVKKQVEDALKPMQETATKNYERQKLTETTRHNDEAFSEALKDYGYDPTRMNKGQLNKLKKALNEYYPHVAIDRDRMTKKQFEVVVSNSIGYRKGAKREKTAKNLVRQNKAPRVVRGNTVSKSNARPRTPQPPKETTLQQRVKMLDDIFSDKKME